VRTAKQILQQDDPQLALLSYRSTPHGATGYSPAQLLLGRQIRSSLPTIWTSLEPSWPNPVSVEENDQKAKLKSKQAFDKSHSAKQLHTLQPGDKVSIHLPSDKNWQPDGVVTALDDMPRSYIINTPTGNVRRNRRHLWPVIEPPVQPTPPVETAGNSIPSTDIQEHCHSPLDNLKNERIKSNSQKASRSGRIIRTPLKLKD
jgi:hypothetical protein